MTQIGTGVGTHYLQLATVLENHAMLLLEKNPSRSSFARPQAIKSRVNSGGHKSYLLWAVRWLLALSFLIAANRAALAIGDDPESRHTLGEQRGVHVVVEVMGLDTEQEKLIRVELQAYVEQSLRAAGIAVFTAEQASKQLGKPALHVRVALNKDGRHRLYAVHISLEFQQEVALVRNAAVQVVAPTWRAEGVGTVAEDQLRIIRQDVGTYVADFIRDYLTMNPPGTKEPAGPLPHNNRPRSPVDKP